MLLKFDPKYYHMDGFQSYVAAAAAIQHSYNLILSLYGSKMIPIGIINSITEAIITTSFDAMNPVS